LIGGAFYPNYFLRGEQGGQIDERDALKKLCGHDPRRSVYLMGMEPEQPGLLYAKLIKNALAECGPGMHVFYEGGYACSPLQRRHHLVFELVLISVSFVAASTSLNSTGSTVTQEMVALVGEKPTTPLNRLFPEEYIWEFTEL